MISGQMENDNSNVPMITCQNSEMAHFFSSHAVNGLRRFNENWFLVTKLGIKS